MKIAVLSNSFNEYSNKEVETDLTETGKIVTKALESFGHEVDFFDVNEKTFEILRKANFDIAFNVCERYNNNSMFEPHVAAMLELLGIPYTGSGPLALALCINKARVKEILLQNGIPTPNFQVFYSKNKKIDPSLRFPLIVKPICMDNSIGILNDSVVNNEKDLRNKVAYITRVYSQPALVEEFIDGREFAIGTLGNNGDSVALPVSEYVFLNMKEYENNILSYDLKWDLDYNDPHGAFEVCPAQIPKYLETKMKKMALEAHKILEVRDYSRIDVRIGEDGIPYVLEMNPNPGISADNTIPKAAKSLGLTYNDMINEILKHALKRNKINIKEEKLTANS